MDINIDKLKMLGYELHCTDNVDAYIKGKKAYVMIEDDCLSVETESKDIVSVAKRDDLKYGKLVRIKLNSGNAEIKHNDKKYTAYKNLYFEVCDRKILPCVVFSFNSNYRIIVSLEEDEVEHKLFKFTVVSKFDSTIVVQRYKAKKNSLIFDLVETRATIGVCGEIGESLILVYNELMIDMTTGKGLIVPPDMQNKNPVICMNKSNGDTYLVVENKAFEFKSNKWYELEKEYDWAELVFSTYMYYGCTIKVIQLEMTKKQEICLTSKH